MKNTDIKQFKIVWLAPTYHEDSETVELSFFTEDRGFNAEDTKAIDSLTYGDTYHGDDLRVTRLGDLEQEELMTETSTKNDIKDAQVAETIDMTPTWVGVLRIYLEVYHNGTTAESKQTALKELTKMANAADQFNEVLKDAKIMESFIYDLTTVGQADAPIDYKAELNKIITGASKLLSYITG